MKIRNGKKNRLVPSPNNMTYNIHHLAQISSVQHLQHRSSNNLLALLIILLVTVTGIQRATGQPLPLLAPAPIEAGRRSAAGVMVVVAVLFFISGFLSFYTRQCVDRRPRSRRLDLTLPFGGRRHNMEPRGLNPDVIESFPTFLYATVKSLMVAKEALACAVCLDEFQDDETLRLIPICNHVFHPDCIDAWLASNSTCPVCRANLVPRSEDEGTVVPPFVAIEIPEEEDQQHQHQENDSNNNNKTVIGGDEDESPNENILGRIRSLTMNRSRTPPRSRSTGFLFGLLFPRPDSVERCEKFSVRLPEEVRRKLAVSSRLKRARSCVSLGRMGSGRSGYRTRSSVGRYERFHGEEEQWEFALLTTPPFADNRDRISSPPVRLHDVHRTWQVCAPSCDHDDDRVLDERSSDHLCPGIRASHQAG